MGLPMVNTKVDWEAMATIFMSRHVERLAPRISRKDYDAMIEDLASWLEEAIEPHLGSPSPKQGE
jgi:hypothetical protein